MPTPASWYAAAKAALAREQKRSPKPEPASRLTDEEIDAIVASIPPLPRTPAEREAIPDYGDLASSVIWYPIYSEVGYTDIICRNCRSIFEDHDPDDGLCPPA